MKAYIYNDEGYFEREDVAQIDPLESKLQDKNIYIMPANSTTLEPLDPKEGFRVKWDGKKWIYEEEPQEEEYIPTEDDLKADKRAERDYFLFNSDKYMLSDFPITEEEREKWVAYRQYLRDYTKQEHWWEESPKTFEDWK